MQVPVWFTVLKTLAYARLFRVVDIFWVIAMDAWLRKRKKPDGPMWCARPLTLYVQNGPSRAIPPSAPPLSAIPPNALSALKEEAPATVDAASHEQHLRLMEENRRLTHENRRLTELNHKLFAACARVCVTSNHVSALAVELLNDKV